MSLALVLALCAAALVGVYGDSCPVSYSGVQQGGPGLLMGGVMNAGCKDAQGAPCRREGYWADKCRFDTSSRAFGVCDASQREAALSMARRLHGGAALQLSPCDLFPYIRGRTLWVMGDSHTKDYFSALQCFFLDFWEDKQECMPSADDGLNRQLDALPTSPGEAKCIHLAGGTRICRVVTVLGSSLAGSSEVADGGVLALLRNHFADPEDIFIMQFGIWDMKKGVSRGTADLKRALLSIGLDYAKNKDRFPHVMYRETPASHDKDKKHNTCRPTKLGDLLDYATGALDIDNKRSAAAALAARGGAVNAPARDILSNFGVPILPGYSISLPLNGNHVMLRGTSDLDCLHYCSFGYSEIMIYELARQLRGGLAGVKPLSDAAAAAAAARPKRVCKPTPGTY